jgi:hypothetical protein
MFHRSTSTTFIHCSGVLCLWACFQPVCSAANLYTGQINGIFNNVQFAGQYINQTAGGNNGTPPNYNFVMQNNLGSAVVTGVGTNQFTWGSCNGCNNAPPTANFSSVTWTPHAFANQAPNADFLLGTITYTNGTINLGTGTFGANMALSANVVDGAGNAVAVTGLNAPFTNWDTVNLNTNYANGPITGLTGAVVVNAAGQMMDNNGNFLLDNQGNIITIPGNKNFYNTFWSADYISFQPGIPFANFTNGLNDAGTFEGGSATFDVFGQIVGDPMIQIDFMVLDSGSEGFGFTDPASEEQAASATPEPLSLGLLACGFAAVMSMQKLRKLRMQTQRSRKT